MSDPTGMTRQVRVDNWGIYFLQRLQVFFSKTDYCDLTLQFEGNVQLKVHRLVMSACTEYFEYLEKTSPAMEESSIMMPPDMQADVIVPIVNFMYTGMLEFHVSLFQRLYRAAEKINIPILMKLLDTQITSKTLPFPRQTSRKVEAQTNATKIAAIKQQSQDISGLGVLSKLKSQWKRRTNSTVHPASATFSDKWSSSPTPVQDPLLLPDNTPKPTRFEWPDDDDAPPVNLMEIGFDEISYTSKPLLTRAEEERAVGVSFDEIRNSAINNRLKTGPSTSKSGSQNINIQEVEEYVKEQKVRTDLTNFEAHEDGVDSSGKRKAETTVAKTSPKRVKFADNVEIEKETMINVKSSVVGDLDHTKIVSEILKKYPSLVKKNKNIKLKIMSNKAEANKTVSVSTNKTATPNTQRDQQKTPQSAKMEKVSTEKSSDDGPWKCKKCEGDTTEFVLYYLYRRHMIDEHGEEFDKRFCRYCGKFCKNDNFMTYHLYTKHGLRPPSTHVYPKCEKCPYIAISRDRYIQHIQTHKPNEARCANCTLGFLSRQFLMSHSQISGHNNKTNIKQYDCSYCMKKLQAAANLFSHIKEQHMREARRDGMVSLDESMDVDFLGNEESDEQPNNQVVVETVNAEEANNTSPKEQPTNDKVKIISNVKVPQITAEGEDSNSRPLDNPTSDPNVALNNVASGIATSLGLVDIVVLDDNQQYILQQQQNQNQTEFILPELSTTEGMLQTANSNINSTDELVMVLTDQDYPDAQSQETSDSSNIVVLYSHPVDGQQGQFITSQGNLLVNSQTGMLELRDNGTTIATTTTNDVILHTPQEGTVESIEMIRREIEGHPQEEKDTSVFESTLDDKEHQTEESIIINSNVTELQAASGNVAEGTPEETNVANNESSEILTHLDEKQSHEVSKSSPNEDIVDGNSQEEPMDIDEEQTPETELSIESAKEVKNVEELQPECVTIPLESNEEKNLVTASLPIVSEETQTVSSASEGAHNDEDVPPTEIRANQPPILFTTDEEQVILNDIEEEEVNHHLNKENNQAYLDDGNNKESSEVTNESTAVAADESMEVDGAGIDSQEQETHEVTLSEEIEKSDNVEATTEHNLEQSEIKSISDKPLDEPQVDAGQPKENTTETPLENPDQVLNESTEAAQDEHTIHVDNDVLTTEEVISTSAAHNDTINTDDAQNVSDEQTKNDDEIPQTLEHQNNAKDTNVASTSEINKSILDDWGDDNDSQLSSDKQRMAAAVENVNKLMDDWEEEEDEHRE